MRVQAIGVKRMSGIGKESGRPFDFSRISYLRQIEVAATEKFQLQGYGYEAADIDLANDAVPKFAQVRFPCTLELEVDNVPGRTGLRAVVVGFKTPKLEAA